MDLKQAILGFIIDDTKGEKKTKTEYKPIIRKQQEQAEARARAVYSEHQENIKKSGMLRTDILKGLQQGENVYILLLKAMKCISLMTGDNLFYTQGKEDIKAVYGLGVEQGQALELELQEVKDRLQLLSRPELQNEPEESRRRINTAIKQHKERIARIEQIIN